MAVLHNMDLLLEQWRVFIVYLNNIVQRIGGLKVWLGVGELTSINLRPKKYLFCFKCWKDFCQPFCFIRISLGLPGNQKQVSQFVSHLAHVLESEGKLVVPSVIPAQQRMKNSALRRPASS